jgi:hypothetical protein
LPELTGIEAMPPARASLASVENRWTGAISPSSFLEPTIEALSQVADRPLGLRRHRRSLRVAAALFGC